MLRCRPKHSEMRPPATPPTVDRRDTETVMTITFQEKHSFATSGRGPAVILAWLRLCLARRSQRIVLGELTDDRLRDLGLTRADAAREASRWPWEGTPR
jgi:uncharacterized protein YjiS (DUF1127 family)